MSDQRTKAAASRIRDMLKRLGVRFSVGTSWNSAGDPVVVVEIPPGVDGEPVVSKLSQEGVGKDVVVRRASRSIVAH